MALKQEPFRKYKDEERIKDTFTVRLNDEEREVLEACKRLMEQEKDSTCLKQVFMVGAINVLHDPKLNKILELLFKNKRNNKRLGIVTYDQT